MKKSISLFLFLLFAIGSMAVVPPTESEKANETKTEILSKKEIKKQARQEKRMERHQKRMAKIQEWLNNKGLDIDLQDPVEKWMWFWIFSWGAGLILGIIAAASITGGIYSGSFGIAALLGTIGWLCWLAGLAFLVIWLVKKFG